MRIIFLIGLLTLLLESNAQETTTFILIRHAEKAKDGTQDPNLSPEGKQRAEVLNKILERSDIASIYSTNFRRTQQTVFPLAQAKGITIQTYQQADLNWLQKVAKENAGKIVLMVGHSNTIPEIANTLLSEKKFEQYPDDLYDQMLVIQYSEKIKPSVLILTY
ncbi:MAG: phosphoglycerate mutase family protein [Cyclobacteriaceae bacterium]|jgi:2,3-bisphosphoglycerate-dependent phosphoglycerate mutase|nr:phosphoglycerate mutase family protein [Cyclobacteriaceae bacterium]